MHPERWSKVYLNWLENIQDWCISRQLWWGHRIPVWYAKGVDREHLTEADLRDPTKIHVSLEGPPDVDNWIQEDDVLDTWASSWLWPFATLGWPDAEAQAKAGFSQFYPTTTLATGADIIFFWVARMIMAGLEFAKPGAPVEERIPFKHVYFNGIVRDRQGRKMSKTLGNSPDPLDLIVKYGADGLRFGLLQIAPLGQDVKFDEDRIESGKGFCNKLWNAARFRQMSGPMSDNSSLKAILSRFDPAHFDDDDHALLAALIELAALLEKCFADFEFAAATQGLYSFFWNDFCDWYVEVAKTRVQDPHAKDHALAVQDLVIRQFLLLFEPFAPFITEELWALLGYASAEKRFVQDTRIETAAALSAAIAKRGVPVDADAAGRVAKLKHVASLARQLKADQSVAQKRDVKFFVLAAQSEWLALEKSAAKLSRLVGAAEIARTTEELALPAIVTPLGTLYLGTGVKIDPVAERVRLTKELDQVTKHVIATEARLGNEAFTSKAPPAVLAGARKQLAEQINKRADLQRLLAALG
jgi:valyl-tRNA synthetase